MSETSGSSSETRLCNRQYEAALAADNFVRAVTQSGGLEPYPMTYKKISREDFPCDCIGEIVAPRTAFGINLPMILGETRKCGPKRQESAPDLAA